MPVIARLIFPILLLSIALVSFQVGWVTMTDRQFLVDELVDQALATNPNARESEIRPRLENISPAILVVPTIVITPIALTALSALMAAYLNFISKFGLREYTFRHWWSLVSWTSLPSLLLGLAGWAVILSSTNGQIPRTSLSPLSIVNLLALDSGKSMLQSLSLPQIWSQVLMVIGYQSFTGKSLGKSAAITLAPFVLIYGIWAAFSFR